MFKSDIFNRPKLNPNLANANSVFEVFSLSTKNSGYHINNSLVHAHDALGAQLGCIMTSIMRTAFSNSLGKSCTTCKPTRFDTGYRFIKFNNHEYDFETGCHVYYTDTTNIMGIMGYSVVRHVLIQNINTGVFHIFQIHVKGSSFHKCNINIHMNEFPMVYNCGASYCMVSDNIGYTLSDQHYQQIFKEFCDNKRKYLYEIDSNTSSGNIICNDKTLEKVINSFVSSFVSCLEECFRTLENVFGDVYKDYNSLYSEYGNSLINLTPIQVERLCVYCTKNYILCNNKVFVNEYVSNLPLTTIYDDLKAYGLRKKSIDALTSSFTGTIGEFCKHYTMKSIKEIPTIGNRSAEIINNVIISKTCDLLHLGMDD